MTCRQCIGQSLAHMMHDVGVAVLLSQFSFQLAPKVQILLFTLTDITERSVWSQIHFNVHAHFCISLLETRGLENRAWLWQMTRHPIIYPSRHASFWHHSWRLSIASFVLWYSQMKCMWQRRCACHRFKLTRKYDTSRHCENFDVQMGGVAGVEATEINRYKDSGLSFAKDICWVLTCGHSTIIPG